MSKPVEINGRKVGPGLPCYIVAELSANHNGSAETAHRLIEIAKDCGADAVKLQTYRPDTITLDSDQEHFVVRGTVWDGRRLYELYEEAHMPWSWQPELFRHAQEIGLDCFSTPFDESAVDFLEGLGAPCHKIASFELTHHPLLRKVAATGKPIIASTGMASLAEIEEAVEVLRDSGCKELVLLKCTSAYPAKPEEANLRTIPHLAQTFDVLAGLSDHTMSVAVPVAAVGLGAVMIEKHLTEDRAIPGPDAAFSLQPDEFAAMVESVRVAEAALGGIRYGTTSGQRVSRNHRRALYALRDLAPGEELTADTVGVLRPSPPGSLAPKDLPKVLGRRLRVALQRGDYITWEAVE